MRQISARLLGVTFLVLWCSAAARADEAQPNVLLIMTDDEGWGDVGRHGNQRIDTPTLDRLRDESVRFERFFVSPVCAPTRASLLSGRYDVRTGVTGVTQRYEVMRADEVTLAEVFDAGGYVTGCFGKWHNGEQYPNNPRGQGFNEFFGFCGGHWNNYFDARLEQSVAGGEDRLLWTDGYITDVLTDWALAFLDAHRDEPFFCYVPYNAPHTPWQVPDRYFDKYTARGLPAATACAYAMVENIDDNIARLLNRLDEHGLRDNTIVIFLTDNGPNGRRFNGGMRGRKGSVHEGGVRVPCFLRWPGELPPHSVEQIAAHVDILPTLAELCDLELPQTKPLDGISLAPLLRKSSADASIDWPDRKLYTFRSTGHRKGKPDIRGAVRTQQYRFVRERGRDQLYDMQADPGQKTDIAGSRPQVLQELRTAFDDWAAEVYPPVPLRTPIPVGHAAAPRVELPAVESRLEGRPKFHNVNGYAHDWVTDWTSRDDRIWWELDVASAGTYEVTLSYACAPPDVGSTVQLAASAQEASTEPSEALTFTIAKAFDTGKLARPERDLSKGPRWMRDFREQPIGRLRLPAGEVRLELQAETIPGGSVCDLDALRLERVADNHN